MKFRIAKLEFFFLLKETEREKEIENESTYMNCIFGLGFREI